MARPDQGGTIDLHESDITMSWQSKISRSAAAYFLNDQRADLLWRQSTALKGDVCLFGIESPPLVKQLGKTLLRWSGKTSRGYVGYPCFQQCQIYLKKNDQAVSLEVSHCRITVDGAATRGNDMIVDAQVEQDAFFNLSKGSVAVVVNNVLQAPLL